ncbi:hypothetical protein DOY81_005118 [Sarcophaga bullata]|nr:hypothetical protein DOY81_005118 [Sarcophaga bullata]
MQHKLPICPVVAQNFIVPMDSPSDAADGGMSLLSRFLKLLQDICKKILLALQHAWELPQICPKVSRPAEKKSKQTGASSHKRKNRKLRPWKQWLAQTSRIKYSMPPSDPEESSFHLQNLFTISSDALKPNASGSKSQQSIQVNIFNMPPAQKAKIEEKLKTEISSTIKVEIVNVAEQQQIEIKEATSTQGAKCYITPQTDIIDISDEESEKVDSDTEKGFIQKTSTTLLEADEPKSSVDSGKQNSKMEIFDMPPVQKAKTEEYIKSQPISSVKAEVVNPIPKQTAVIEDLHKESKTEITANVGGTFEMTSKPLTSNNCETTSVGGSHQNIMVKIYNPPKMENTNETPRVCGQGSSLIQFEIINMPLTAAAGERETKSATKLQIQIPTPSEAKITNSADYKISDTDLVKPVPTATKEQSSTFKSPQPIKLVRNSKTNTTSTLSQIPSATSKSSSKSSFPTLRMRQMELHRLRVQVEHKRLELLNLKLAREWHEMERLKVTSDKTSKTKYFDSITVDDVIDI